MSTATAYATAISAGTTIQGDVRRGTPRHITTDPACDHRSATACDGCGTPHDDDRTPAARHPLRYVPPEMQRRTFLLSAGASAVLLSFTSKLSFAKEGAKKMPSEPLLAPWTGPYGGVPPFNK